MILLFVSFCFPFFLITSCDITSHRLPPSPQLQVNHHVNQPCNPHYNPFRDRQSSHHNNLHVNPSRVLPGNHPESPRVNPPDVHRPQHLHSHRPKHPQKSLRSGPHLPTLQHIRTDLLGHPRSRFCRCRFVSPSVVSTLPIPHRLVRLLWQVFKVPCQPQLR